MKTLIKLSLFFSPFLALAEEDDVGSGRSGLSGKDLNPLGHTDLIQFLTALLDVVIKVGMVLMVVMFVWVGLQFVTAGGNEGQIKTAKAGFKYAVIGSAIVLGAFVIITVLQGTIDAIRN